MSTCCVKGGAKCEPTLVPGVPCWEALWIPPSLSASGTLRFRAGSQGHWGNGAGREVGRAQDCVPAVFVFGWLRPLGLLPSFSSWPTSASRETLMGLAQLLGWQSPQSMSQASWVSVPRGTPWSPGESSKCVGWQPAGPGGSCPSSCSRKVTPLVTSFWLSLASCKS